MVVIKPCDYNQTKAATIAIADYVGPVYLRFGRPAVPIFMPEDQEFIIGKAIQLTEGSDVTIVATGHLVWEALQASEKLEAKGISRESGQYSRKLIGQGFPGLNKRKWT